MVLSVVIFVAVEVVVTAIDFLVLVIVIVVIVFVAVIIRRLSSKNVMPRNEMYHFKFSFNDLFRYIFPIPLV